MTLCITDTPTTQTSSLSLHDALPISLRASGSPRETAAKASTPSAAVLLQPRTSCFWAEAEPRSEEHTSELQSHSDLVCRLLLEKKKKQQRRRTAYITAYDAPATWSWR